MEHLRPIVLTLAFPCVTPSIAHAQGAGIELDILNQEVMEPHRAGKHDRAETVALQALDVAEQKGGPDHPDVATILENLESLYLDTRRKKEA